MAHETGERTPSRGDRVVVIETGVFGTIESVRTEGSTTEYLVAPIPSDEARPSGAVRADPPQEPRWYSADEVRLGD